MTHHASPFSYNFLWEYSPWFLPLLTYILDLVSRILTLTLSPSVSLKGAGPLASQKECFPLPSILYLWDFFILLYLLSLNKILAEMTCLETFLARNPASLWIVAISVCQIRDPLRLQIDNQSVPHSSQGPTATVAHVCVDNYPKARPMGIFSLCQSPVSL